jgi:hypothetical protein
MPLSVSESLGSLPDCDRIRQISYAIQPTSVSSTANGHLRRSATDVTGHTRRHGKAHQDIHSLQRLALGISRQCREQADNEQPPPTAT